MREHGSSIKAGGHLRVHLRGDCPKTGLGQQAAEFPGSACLQGLNAGVGAAVQTGPIQCPVLCKKLKDVLGGCQQIFPGTAVRVLRQAGGNAFLLQSLQEIMQQLLLVIEMRVKGGAVHHGPAADIHHRQLLKRTFCQKLCQGFHEKPAGFLLPQVQMIFVLMVHDHASDIRWSYHSTLIYTCQYIIHM